MSDPGEEPADGSLLVAAHGRGHFVYTGVSFFRQLPAGTSGAYRLFENLIALGAAGEAPRSAAADESPPFGSWNVVYAGVAGLLIALIGLFLWISRRYG
jgi:hypothetical protein